MMVAMPSRARQTDKQITVAAPDASPAAVPRAWPKDPLIKGHHFFTLPVELLEDIVAGVGERKFDARILDLDRGLARESGDHSTQIGYRDGQPILYGLLGKPLSVSATIAEGMTHFSTQLNWPALTAAQRHGAQSLDERSNWVRKIARGYGGWLCTNEEFVKEQDKFFSQWKRQCTRYGLNGPSPDASAPCSGGSAGDYRRFTNARDQLLAKWSLTGLAAPFLPVTAMPQFPAAPAALAGSAASLGVSIFYPSIFPLPNANLLRTMFEDAIPRHRLPPHLQGWSDIITNDSQAKKSIEHYGRILSLQHFWRTLFSRHAASLRGNIRAVRRAFAAYLIGDKNSASAAESIRKDLGALSKVRGGAHWFASPSVYNSI